MRLAILSGCDTHTAKWVTSLSDRGHEVHLVTLDREGTIDGVTVHRLPFQRPWGYYLNARNLRRLLERISPDLLHVHYASGHGTLGRLSGFRPCVLSVWGSDVFEFPHQSRLKRRWLEQNLRHYDHICSTSQALADQVARLCPDLARPTVIAFGVDTAVFAADNRTHNMSTVTLAMLKSLEHYYAIDVTLEALAEARRRLSFQESQVDLRLRIAGDGSLKAELVALAASLSLGDCVEFVGRIPHSEVPEFLNSVDVLVNASRTESFGVAVLEASACGIPVIASDVGGLPEVVRSGVTGLVVRSEDREDLTAAIVKLASDPGLRARMGSAGRDFVSQHYQWSDCVTAMERVYQDVLSGSSSLQRAKD